MKENDIPIALPFMGEWGSKISKHVPGIYGIPRPLIIAHEAGEEAIYPDATERYIYERPKAIERKAGGNIYQVKTKGLPLEGRIPYHDQVKIYFEPNVWEDHLKTGKPPQWQRKYIAANAPSNMPHKYFIPQSIGTYECDFDIVLFARCQQYAAARNFPFWIEVEQALAVEGIKCLVVGQPDSTASLNCPSIWDLVDNTSQILDASIWAISQAKMRIGSPTGTTLLTLLCGQNVVILMSETGHEAQGSKMSLPAGYYYKIDTNRVGYRVIAHWMEWERAVEEILWMYSDLDKFNQDCKDWIKKIDNNLAIPDPDIKWRNLK